jgi:hypothetical protein
VGALEVGCYWDREQSKLGQQVNDVLDGMENLRARVRRALSFRFGPDSWTRIDNAMRASWRAEGPVSAPKEPYGPYQSVGSVKADDLNGQRNKEHGGGADRTNEQTSTSQQRRVTPSELAELERKYSADQAAQADREWNSGPSGEYVTLIKSGAWTVANGGGQESNTDIGKSASGFHYGNSYASPYSDPEKSSAGWSKPFKTREVAERVGFAAEMASRGETWHLSDRRRAGIEAQERQRTTAIRDRVVPR